MRVEFSEEIYLYVDSVIGFRETFLLFCCSRQNFDFRDLILIQ